MEMGFIVLPKATAKEDADAPRPFCQACVFAENASAKSQGAKIDAINAIIAESIGT